MRLKISEVNNGGDQIVKLEGESPTLGDLLRQVGKINAEDYIGLELKYGYPIQTVAIKEDNLSLPLRDLNISNGEKIIIIKNNDNNKRSTRSVPNEPVARHLEVKKVPDDNSCLFHCLSYGIYGNMNYSTQIRRQISEYISHHRDQYNDRAILDGKSVTEYCQWIEDYNSWGGYIEICIIPRIYENVTLWVCDIINNYIDKISIPGKSDDTITRGNQIIVLLYNGVHYDLLEYKGQYSFYPQDMEWLDKESRRIMQKNKHKTFDSRRAQIKCNQCGKTFIGEKDVSTHVMETSHSDFIQI